MPVHESLTQGRWHTLSLAEQMGNIGSEVDRAAARTGIDDRMYSPALERAFELLDLTIADPRWRKRLKELIRVREFLADAAEGGNEYKSSFENLSGYFLEFAIATRIDR